MWKKIAPLLVVLSVALNAAFIGIWVVRVSREMCSRDGTSDGPVWCPLHRALEVTEEQWQEIEPRLAEFRRQSQATCADMNRLRGELIDCIAAGKPDQQAIAAKQEEIRAGQKRMQTLVIEHLLAEKEVLTAEQEKEMFGLLRRRIACAGPGRMLGMSGADSERPAPAEEPSGRLRDSNEGT